MATTHTSNEGATPIEPRARDEGPIRTVHVFSTGWGEQHREHRYGSWMPRLMWVLTSRSWVKVPINAFLIHHRDGPVLFDTGLDPAIKTDPAYISKAIGRFLLHRIFRLHISPNDALQFQLDALGVAARNVRKAVISHLHFDHIGGIAQIPNAELLVSEQEWQQLSAPHPEREWILREHIELPNANWRPISFAATDDPLLARFGGAFDIMGDGSMILLPTPGHTPGSMSMLVRSEGLPPILLVGDLTYESDLLFQDKVPGTGNAQQLRASFAHVRTLKVDMPDLVVLPSHDPGTGEALKRALAGAHA